MKCMPRWIRLGALASAVVICAMGQIASAAIAPYSPDVNTTGLWHFDETAGGDTANTSATLNTDYNLTLSGGAAIVSTGSLGGFGNHLSTSGASGEIAGKGGDSVSGPSLVGGAGEFTVELLVKINDLDQNDRMLFSLERDGSSSSNRIMHFWYWQDGGPSIQLEDPATGNDPSFVLPTTGPNALNTTDWFHVAFTYNGDPDDPENLKFYWTKADPANTVANLFGTDALDADLRTGTATNIGVGNNARGTAGSASFNGSIDEVRFSNVVRGPNQFIFSVPEPTSMLMICIGSGGLGLLRWKRRK